MGEGLAVIPSASPFSVFRRVSRLVLSRAFSSRAFDPLLTLGGSHRVHFAAAFSLFPHDGVLESGFVGCQPDRVEDDP